MHIPTVLALVVLQCARCPSIRVPVDWTPDSEVNTSEQLPNTVKHDNHKLIPNEYFHYPAKKPQFVVDIAKSHGVQSPESLFKPQPVKPHTGLPTPQLGKHRIQPERIIAPYRGFVQNAGGSNYAKPATTSFEVFHPYKAEEPALQQLYKDPNLDKIRNNLRDANQKLQQYHNEAGQTDVKKGEYLESPEQTDRKKVPHKNVPTQFEVHRPQRRPVYYRYPSKQNFRENLVNQKLRDPWRQNIAKVTPIHYRPIKHHLHGLRQQHALKFDDERNEYPQLPPKDDEEESEGYDIYQKGKERFVQLRNNVDDTINKVVQENRPQPSRNVEQFSDEQDDDDTTSKEEDENDFVPIKNYAQVRKTEITKHLPKEAALHDAESYEEIQNAPRLREAIKSKKAQIVYSEEGYEDTAYDHAGEQKHASDHENHGGYLKENAESKGKYKTPTLFTKHGTKEHSKHGNQIEHDEKWDNDIKQNEDEDEDEYYESEEGESDVNDINEESDENSRNKRNSEHIIPIPDIKTSDNPKTIEPVSTREVQGVIKGESKNTIIKEEKDQISSKLKDKYPYYFQNIKLLSKNSPLRYAENFKHIPKKSSYGSEFYDSRSELECPEVEDDVDAIPEKLKKDGHPDESLENLDEKAKDKAKFSTLKNKQRLKGLGDKIDCFKVKYFGENPLDNPFFGEDTIENPEPVTKPNSEVFENKQKYKFTEDNSSKQSSNIYNVLNKLRNNQNYKSPNKSVISDSNVTLSRPHLNNIGFVRIRKKRATPFTYEPYKIIRDSQVPDSKKTTTTGNISPLIKQLQQSRVIDKVTINQDKDQTQKKNNTKVYKNIGKTDRQENKNYNNSNEPLVASFVDVNSDLRKVEPRYEIRPANHKPQYTPVENKKAISLSDYKAQQGNLETTTPAQLKRAKRRKPTMRPYFDVSQYLPKSLDTQYTAASNTVRRIIRTTTIVPTTERVKRHKIRQSNNNEKEHNEYNDKDKLKTSTTTSVTPQIIKQTRGTTTTSKTIEIEKVTESPKLRLVTRFRDYDPNEKTLTSYDTTENPSKSYDNERISPKYTEKKRKSTKSTLVTDTKSYGEGDEEDIRKEEVDDLIGVKHDTDEYIPLYERVVNKINRMKEEDLNKKREHTYDSEVYGDSDDKFHFGDDDDDDDEEEEDDEDTNDDDDDDEEEEENGEKEEKEKESDIHHKESSLELTTSEPTKRTLAKTTEAPATTTESRSAKIQLKPTISKKKVEIHKELPVNKSSPHVTQFKQDIKEFEIIKELKPKLKQKSNKNTEALDLFRDEKLAEEVNKLGDVEVFRENLDLTSGPKHGGNYRSITPEDLEKESRGSKNADDVATSQTETKKFIEVNKDIPSRRRGNSQVRNTGEKSAKFVELRDTYDPKPRLHGGNLKLPQSRGQSRNSKSERYVDIDDDDNEEPSSMHGGNFKSYGNSRNSGRQMHGGNYRSAKLVQPEKSEEKPTQSRGKSRNRGNAATSLNGYARAVPILTTTPAYILDPSKRMYYYVDA
ncbi:MATH and LRR domain-containing protein PFE0570w-like [Bicyclus anynana]|uniref:MATH and LRR domain-containing protein PFE0570w-like n=1 Tax=Bicyclus anynana TaxID=110368 RepID=A0A6J1MTL5_BICAN|nr:MATH and LRR domain-containing protein PFE0570w-like [Bicyclus anynana]